MERLKGKVAIVTGAARGIGRACAIALARQGADVTSCDIAQDIKTVNYPLATKEDLEETARQVQALGRKCLAVQADVRSMPAMQGLAERTIKELGQIDIMVPNAGVNSFHGGLASMTVEQWQDVLDVNLTGVANSMRAVIPHMTERKQGRIVVVGSSSGRHGVAGTSHYSASKWGVIGLVKSVALELAPNNITVNAVLPTGVRTGMAENDAARRWASSDNPTQEAMDQALLKYNALPVAFLEPKDVADSVVFLCSPEARYISGVALDVAAGANARYTA